METCRVLFDSLRIPQKNLNILKFNQTRPASREEELIKSISESLRDIEMKYLSADDRPPAWQRLYQHRRGVNEKTKRLVIEKMYRQLKECTFQPMSKVKKAPAPLEGESLRRHVTRLIRE